MGADLPAVISRENAKARGLKHCSCAARLALVLALLALTVLGLALMLFAAY